MALKNPLPPPEPPYPDSSDLKEREYDDAVADSFPASDPPAGVIKVGPRHVPPERRVEPTLPPQKLPRSA